MKICVYTCITHGYDRLHRFPVQNGVDFLCFTDDPQMDSKGWRQIPIPHIFNSVPENKKQRLVKILPHRFLDAYDISVWIDGNIVVCCDISNFVNGLDIQNSFFFTRHHPTRNSIYREARSVILSGKDRMTNISPQLNRYRRDGFPDDFGLIESNIIVRRHNDPDCVNLDEMWGKEVFQGSHRDQLSFNYCLWKTGLKISYLDVNNLIKDERFRYVQHGK